MIFNKKLVDTIAHNLIEKHQTIAVAESVTGGLLQASFTFAEDASLFFQGGITAYNVGQKYRHLLVEPLHALSCDSVSLEIAECMSKHVCNLFASNYGISTTGYAALSKEKNITRLYTFYAIAKKNEIIDSGKIISTANEGFDTQIFYVNMILGKLVEYLIFQN